MKIKSILSSILLVMNISTIHLALAQTTHSSVATTKASATLAATCSISSSNLNFGQLDVTQTYVPSSSNIAVSCTKGSAYQIQLTLGTWGSESLGRKMKGAVSGDTIGYLICKNNVAVGGNCDSVADRWYNTYSVYNGVGNGVIQNIPVYGFAYPTYVTPDTYSDTTTATIVY